MKNESENGRASCPNPIDAAILADYWLAALPSAEEAAVEEHLLGCDPCGAKLSEVIALAEQIRNLAREASLRLVVSEEFLKRAAEEGLRIRQYAPPRGGDVQCTVTPQDDVLIGRLAANLSGAKRIDLSICDEQGREQFRLPDIPFRPEADSVIVQESISLAKAAPSYTMIMRMVSLDEQGNEQLLGDYTFRHTRTMPGPASW